MQIKNSTIPLTKISTPQSAPYFQADLVLRGYTPDNYGQRRMPPLGLMRRNSAMQGYNRQGKCEITVARIPPSLFTFYVSLGKQMEHHVDHTRMLGMGFD